LQPAYHEIRKILHEKGIPTSTITRCIQTYLNSHFWRDFNGELREKFVGDIVERCEGAETHNAHKTIAAIKEWAWNHQVPYEQVYRLYHYKMHGQTRERKNRSAARSRSISHKISTSELKYFIDYIQSREISRPKDLTDHDRKHLLDKLFWTPQQLDRRLAYYTIPRGQVTKEKVRHLKQWFNGKHCGKNVSSSDLEVLQHDLELNRQQIRGILRCLFRARPKVTQSKRETIVRAYEAYCERLKSENRSAKPREGGDDASNPTRHPAVEVTDPLIIDLSQSTRVQRYEILRVIDQHRKQPCESEQRLILANFVRENNFLPPAAHEIKEIAQYTRLTHRQIYHYLEQILNPPGEWTPQKKMRIDALVREHDYAPFAEMSQEITALTEELDLSRKQIRDYVHYQRKKRLRKE